LRRVVAGNFENVPELHVDRDLDWIVMKCLEKDRTRRYETTRELAADLQRYLNQEPVLARPQSTAYRLSKALRRHRTGFAAAAAILLAVFAGSTVSVWQALRATRAERVSEQGRKNEEVLRQNADRERERALESQDRAELNEYVADINLAHQSILAGNLARATELLVKHRQTGSQRFEWRYLWHEAQGDNHTLLSQGDSPVLSLANSKDYLVVGLQNTARIYNPKTGSLVKSLPKSDAPIALPKPGASIALSAAGLLATASMGTVNVWRTSDWAEAYSIPEQRGPVAFSPDGRRLAATSFGGVQVYNSANGKLVGEIPEGRPPFAFSSRGDLIAADTTNGIVLWDLNVGKVLRILEHSDGLFNTPGLWGMDTLAFSPDGHLIVAAQNALREGSIFVLEEWDTATGRKVATAPANHEITEHAGVISSIAFAPSGRLLASGSWDHSIRLWNVGTLQCVERLYGNPSEVWAVAFTADEQGVISGAKDGTVRLWPTNTVAKERFYPGSGTPLKFSKDGQLLAAIDDQSKFVVLNLKTGKSEVQLQLSKNQWIPWGGSISDDFRVLVNPLPESGLRIWDLQNRTSLDLPSQDWQMLWTAISPDGISLLAGTEQDIALWWNLQKPSEAPLRIGARGAIFSRNGSTLVTLHEKSLKVWDPEARSLKAEFPVEAGLGFMTPLALSDDGNVLAVASNPLTETENAIRLWDLRSGKFLGIYKGHAEGIRWLAFSPDGETLASASSDSTLRFWDLRTQEELLSIQRLADPIGDILFSPDGNWLVGKTATGLRLLDGSRELDAGKMTAPGWNSAAQ
jgi:WD40 repeat protein